MESTFKKKVYIVAPNIPSGIPKEGVARPDNVNYHAMMAYFDHKKGQFTWVDEFDNIKHGSYKKDDKVKMLTITPTEPNYVIEISDVMSDSEKNKLKALVDFFKNWPIIAHAIPNGKVNSYPTDNHKLAWKADFQNDPKSVLAISKQPFKFIDENKVEEIRNVDLKNIQKFVISLAAVQQDEKTLEQVAFLLGLNPIEMEKFQVENLIYDYVTSNKLFDEYFKIVDNKLYDDPAEMAVAIGVSMNLIVKSDAGNYQFQGEVISKELKDVAYYFRSNRAAWNALKIELSYSGHTLPDEPVSAKNISSSAKTVKPKKEQTADDYI